MAKKKILTETLKKNLLLIAIGAVIAVAASVNENVACLNLLGWILMLVGGVRVLREVL